MIIILNNNRHPNELVGIFGLINDFIISVNNDEPVESLKTKFEKISEKIDNLTRNNNRNLRKRLEQVIVFRDLAAFISKLDSGIKPR